LSTIKVNNIQSRTGNAISFTSGDTVTIPSGATFTNNGTATGFGGGKIGQVISVTKTDSFTSTTTSFIDITGLSLNITPTSTLSKILFKIYITYGGGNNAYNYLRMVRDSTPIALGTTATGDQVNATIPANLWQANSAQDRDEYKAVSSCMEFLDSPSTTSQVTYKVQAYVQAASAAFVLNQPEKTDNGAYIGRYVSTITAMEVLA
jgi:hypothetical protein